MSAQDILIGIELGTTVCQPPVFDLDPRLLAGQAPVRAKLCFYARLKMSIGGTLNGPEVLDKGWPAEFALAWEGLELFKGGSPMLPKPGDELRITACHAFRIPPRLMARLKAGGG